MSKDWDTSSLEAMEKTAKGQADNSCSKRIKGRWLDVVAYEASGPNDGYFKYTYFSKPIARADAVRLFENL